MRELDLAGMTGLDGEGLARPVPSRGWLKLFKVTLEGEYLVSSLEHEIVECEPLGTDLLQAFTKLRDASPTQIADFAQRYGVLELCQHHLPRTHWDLVTSDPDAIPQPGCVSLSCPDKLGYSQEPIEDWKNLARGLSAVLRVAADLHRSLPVALDTWKDICALGTGARHSFWQHLERCEHLSLTDRHTYHRRHLSRVINWLTQVAHVHPWFRWSDTGTGIEFGGPAVSGLFGHLILQLILAVNKKEAFAVCTKCSKEYLPSRRPAQSRKNFCPDCRNASVPQKEAALRYWRKTGWRKRKEAQSKRKKELIESERSKRK
jgi:hypothetical protein